MAGSTVSNAPLQGDQAVLQVYCETHFPPRVSLVRRLRSTSMTTLTAHFDGKVLVPDEPVELPVNCALKVQVEPVEQSSPLKPLVELAKRFPVTDGPKDGAAQHDHYLYGLPKRP